MGQIGLARNLWKPRMKSLYMDHAIALLLEIKIFKGEGIAMARPWKYIFKGGSWRHLHLKIYF